MKTETNTPTETQPDKEEEVLDRIADYMVELILLAINVPAHYLISGLTLSLLWAWLIVPQFPVDRLTFVQCISILILTQFIKKRTLTEEEKKRTYGERLFILVMWCGLMLLIGFVASLFI